MCAAFLVDAFALAFERLLVLLLLVIQVLLEGRVHFQSRIKSVFNRVVCTTMHVTSDQGPLFAILEVQVHQLLVFLNRPLVLRDFRVQMVVPSFSALLAYPTWQNGSDEVPPFSAMLNDHLLQLLVLRHRPSALGPTLHLILLLKT